MAFKLGTKSDEVKNLQKLLISKGFQITVDGVYGSKTQEAYIQYQSSINSFSTTNLTLATNVVEFATSCLGQEEISGNLGFKTPWFYKMMIGVGFQKTHPWCCYFAELCWKEGYKKTFPNDKNMIIVLDKLFSASVMQTRNNFIKNGSEYGFEFTKTPTIGSLIIYQSATNKSFGHIGVVTKITGNSVVTIEGNTDTKGSREGIAVAQKIRVVDYTVKSKGLNLIGFITLSDLK